MTNVVSRFSVAVALTTSGLLAGCADNPEPEVVVEKDHYYIEADGSNFQKVVLEADKPVLVDFWAPWCGPCRQIAPAVEELAKEYDGRAVVVKVNYDDAPELAERYDITSIPNLMFFRNGEQVDQIVGAPQDAKAVIEAKLAEIVSDAPAQ